MGTSVNHFVSDYPVVLAYIIINELMKMKVSLTIMIKIGNDSFSVLQVVMSPGG